MPDPRDKRAVLAVKCPGCGNRVEWTEASGHRPFCSARCKDGDFIDWAEEQHRIGGASEYDDILSGNLDE